MTSALALIVRLLAGRRHLLKEYSLLNEKRPPLLNKGLLFKLL
jgi:hypothetical protein